MPSPCISVFYCLSSIAEWRIDDADFPTVGTEFIDDANRESSMICRVTGWSNPHRCIRKRKKKGEKRLTQWSVFPVRLPNFHAEIAPAHAGCPGKQIYGLCMVANIIARFYDSKLHFPPIFKGIVSTQFGIDLPKFEEWLPTKELQRLHTTGVSCLAQKKSRF